MPNFFSDILFCVLPWVRLVMSAVKQEIHALQKLVRRNKCCSLFFRFAISTGYYGLTWQLTSLPGNKYLNFFIGGFVETVAYALVIPVTLR